MSSRGADGPKIKKSRSTFRIVVSLLFLSLRVLSWNLTCEMNEVQSSDPVDPLQGYTGLAVFPNSGKILPDNSKPYDIGNDLQTIHTQLKSVVPTLALSPFSFLTHFLLILFKIGIWV